MAADDDRALIDEQIVYYRAPREYDRTSTPEDDLFAAAAGRIRAALRSFEPRGRVLELAAGTGQLTGLLAERADDLLATDASPEMLELNAARVANPAVRYRVTDAFALEATHDHDVVFGLSSSRMCRRHGSRPSGASWRASWRRADASILVDEAGRGCRHRAPAAERRDGPSRGQGPVAPERARGAPRRPRVERIGPGRGAVLGTARR